MEKPFVLQYMEVLDERCDLDQKGKYILYSQQAGHEGEIDMNILVNALLPADCIYLKNLHYQTLFNRCQIDSILILPDFVQVFEVKNLKSEYTYENGVWTTNGYELNTDYFDQAARNRKIVGQILEDHNLRPEINAQLVLINEQDTVTIRDASKEGKYLKRWQIQSYIKKLLAKRNYKGVSVNQLADVLITSSSEPAPPTQKPYEFGDGVFHGIVCRHCKHRNIDTQSQRVHVLCRQCGFAEVKELAVLRTICELGLLYYTVPLTRRFINECLSGYGLEYVVKKVFTKYFVSNRKGPNAAFVNPMRQYQYAFKDVINSRRYRDYFIK